jgi:starvation-inducible DNA-binding protein
MSRPDVNTGLSEKQRGGVVKILNTLLADEYVLYTKTRNYHWNVIGSDFHALHKFFQEQYEQLDEIADDVAERVRALGGVSAGSLDEFIRLTRLSEKGGAPSSAERMIENLMADHEAVIRSLREDLVACDEKFGDTGTNDFLTGLMETHEKMAWMLRAHLER